MWRHGNPIDSSGHTSLITSEHWKQKVVVMLWPIKIFRGQQSQIDFLLGIDNGIPKVILNLQ